MASPPQAASQPIAHVFRWRAEYSTLDEIPAAIWAQIAQHQRPLQPANATVRLLLIQGHDNAGLSLLDEGPTAKNMVCESIDPLQLQTDNFGFLLTWDASPKTVLPQLTSTKSSVIDSRQRFLQRYISHRHTWRPSKMLLAQALLQAGYVDLSQ